MMADPGAEAAIVRRRTRRARRLAARHGAAAAVVSRLGAVRLVAFLLAAGLLAAAGAAPAFGSPLGALAGVSSAVFLAAILVQRRPRAMERLLGGARDAALREEARARGERVAGADGGALAACPELSEDLSLTGPRSLFELVSRCATPMGRGSLARSLTSGGPVPGVLERQAAVLELVRLEAFRSRLWSVAGAAPRPGAAQVEPEALERAVAEPSLHDERPWLAPAGRLLVAVTWIQALVGWWLDVPTAVWPCLLLQVGLFAATSRRTALPAALATALPDLAGWSRLFAAIERRRFDAPLLRSLRAQLVGPEASAARAVADLSAIGEALSVQGLLHPVVNALLLWDLHHSARLATWRRRFGSRVKGWLEAVGEVEALASLAAHAALLPERTLPVLEPGGPPLVALDLRHPLLPFGRAVPNDVVLDAPGVLLVTGSNMSGKSTLLRAVGLHAALALAGGLVPARRLSLAPCRVMTSVRVTDSLEEGLSLFLAEVRRLKSMLAAIDAADADPAALPVLFLVDEILRGTNTRERLVASRWVVRRLAASRSAGLVTSHDLALTELAGTLRGVRNAHFREEISDGRMTFDHVLRPGPVTTTNALEILRLEGIDVLGET